MTWSFAFVAALAFGACGSGSDTATEGSSIPGDSSSSEAESATEQPITVDDLNGRYISTSITDPDGQPAGTVIHVSFEDDQLAFNTGCNWNMDSFQLVGGQVTEFGPSPGSTMVDCGEDEDDFMIAFLRTNPFVEIGDYAITLTSPAGTVIEFLDENAPQRRPPLLGTTWTSAVVISEFGQRFGIGTEELVLTFEDDTTLRWANSCADVTVPVAVSFGSPDAPDSVDVGDLAFTPNFGSIDVVDLSDCSEGAQATADIASVLSESASFSITGTTLTIENPNGTAIEVTAN